MRSLMVIPLAIILSLALVRIAAAEPPYRKTSQQDAQGWPEHSTPPPKATASETKASDADAQDAIEEQVREHVAKGKQYHLQKQFALSIKEWEAAYRLSPKPTYLFNIATVHYRAGHLREAVAGYKLFLSKEPEHPVPALRLEASSNLMDIQTILRQQDELDLEKKRPLRKKPWFWAVLGSVTVATGVALGVGLGLGLKDNRDMLTITFPGQMKSALIGAR